MGKWNNHPRLQGKFHPDFPNDLQIILHEGGSRLSQKQPEGVWVSITDAIDDNIFKGVLLNQPKQLPSFTEGDIVLFIVPTSGELPLFVSEKYLKERKNWTIQPCDKCGLSELFDAPSDLIPVIFPHIPPNDELTMFSSFCSYCGGTQMVLNNKHTDNYMTLEQANNSELSKTSSKPWWKFW